MQKKFIYILLFVISLVSITTSAAANEHTAETQHPNTGNIQTTGLDLLTLLRNHRYDELDRQLNMLQFDYERKTDQEIEVKKAISSLSISDPEIETLFQDWLKLYPNSYVANLSSGSYYLSMAIEWRGGKYFNEIHPKRIEKMYQYLDKASEHLIKSLQFSSKPTISYSKLIAIARYHGDDNAIKHWFEEALKHDPLCAAPRTAYMRTLEPRWGGSQAAMVQFAKETHKVGYPKIEKIAKIFDGWIYWYNGNQHYLNKNYVAALNEFNKAIALDPTNEGGFISDRAEIYQIVGQTDLALADINLQLQSDPLSAQALLLRGNILLDKRQPTEALENIRVAAELYNIDAIRKIGDLYTRGNYGVPMNIEEGIKWLKKAAYFMDEYSSFILGGMNERGLGMPVDNVAAVKYYRIAAEQGYGLAINDLAMMLWYGRGTPINRDEAIQLWLKGSEKNIWQSKHNLQFFISTPELFKLALKHPRLFIDDKRLLIIGIGLVSILLIISLRLIIIVRKRPKLQQNTSSLTKIKLIPYDKFEVQTSLTLEETITTLKAQVEPKKWLRWFSRDHAIFEGDVSREGFKIMRIIHYRNSFMPVIRGTFKQSQNGVNVMIRMGLHPFVMAFLCIWFGFMTVGLFAGGAGLLNGTPLSAPLLIPLAMLIFGWIMVSGGFWFEARKAKPQLLSILHGQIKSEQSHPANPK